MTDPASSRLSVSQRRKGAVRIGMLAAGAAGPAFARRGFAGADLAVHWPEIVGAGVARYSRPLQIHWPKNGAENGVPATLSVACAAAFALDLQQMAPVLIERINQRLGWRAITRLTIKQMPVSPPEQPEPALVIEAEDRELAGRIAAGIGNDTLRQAAERLGAAIIARQRNAAKRQK